MARTPRELLEKLRGDYAQADVDEAVAVLTELRNQREYEPLLELADAVGRVAPDQPTARRLYAQALIETGKITAAIDVLETLRARLSAAHPEALEAAGLLGRSYKQIYFDARMRGSPAAQGALARAIETYRNAYAANAANTWHGVNLLALIEHCRRLGIPYLPAIKAPDLAQELLATLRQMPEKDRDGWYLATVAEVSLATGDWGVIESSLLNYTHSPEVHAFHIASTLRQLTKIWRIDEEERGKAIVDVLTACLMTKGDTSVNVAANQVKREQPGAAHYEAVLGPIKGTQTKRWWATALERASSVAAVRKKLGGRIGTGFLVRARDLGLEKHAETLVLTNYHVVNEKGAYDGIHPDDAEVVFEAVSANKAYLVRDILWNSPPEECDVSVLRLAEPVADVVPLQISRALPVLEAEPPQPQVYIIGHPGGLELTFSFQDNEIIDHEGPDAGKPARTDLRRIHYRAGTEGGSSGSPVFNSSWDVIALHHKGGKIGMPKLNGKDGTYAANEGVWMQSIITQLKAWLEA